MRERELKLAPLAQFEKVANDPAEYSHQNKD